jgi:phosphorylase/glycogen(starch) synthase
VELAGLNPEDIGIELVFAEADKKGVLHIKEKFDYVAGEIAEDGSVTYHVSALPDTTGMYQVGVRMYPRNPELPHRQDFPLAKWL